MFGCPLPHLSPHATGELYHLQSPLWIDGKLALLTTVQASIREMDLALMRTRFRKLLLQQSQPEEQKPDEAYGSLLALRAVAAAAINRGVSPAMLRVFCVLAEYANGGPGEDLECRVGEHAISARLDVTRQAVNRQIAALEGAGLIERHEAAGRTTRYILNTGGLRNLQTGRARWERVEERREQNRIIRQAARQVKL